MQDFYHKLLKRKDFIDIDFDKSPYKFLSAKGIELNSLIESFLQNLENQKKNNIDNNNKEKEKRIITFTYENEKYDIFKNPVNFKMLYANKTIFKAYNESQLRKILLNLSPYYYFYINDHFEYILNKIVFSENSKEIILYPFFTKLFFMLNYTIEPDVNKIKIKKELLEPMQLYIEKIDIISKAKIKSFDEKKLINEELIFIFNEKRKQFINELNQYVNKAYIIEPMKIVGNEGIGKSLTLQFYSSIKLDGYYKLYFNLKLFEKYGLKNYFFIDLIRGFLSKEENKIYDDIKNYIDCVNYMQKLNHLNTKDFFAVLMELINYLESNRNKYIIILDQFKYEYINENDFDIFTSKINKEYFRLIVCCSLNDGKIKLNLFKEYESDILWIKDIEEENESQTKENEKREIEIDDNDSIKTIEENKITLKNINIFKKRKENILNQKGKVNPFQNSNKEEENKKINISDNTVNDYIKNEKSLNNNSNMEIKEKIGEPKYIYNFPLLFPENNEEIIPCETTPIKIYYNNLVNLQQLIKEKEPEEIYNFMSNFNYLPKYYKKFNVFRLNQKLNDIKDNNEILNNFKKKMNNKISKNIKNFYVKGSNFDIENINIYNYIFEFKRKINEYNNKIINFKELYFFAKKYPMKYIIVESEDNINNISFNDSIIEKKFSINYSFPFIEYVLNNIIEEYNSNTKINIKDLSGSAFGNALELKIRNHLSEFKEKIDIRKVWVLNLLSEKVKKSKVKEIENKTLNSYRYLNLEDICHLKPLKDFNYFYFHPESIDNYLFDSILIINHRDNNFSLIAFQITKYKNQDEIKSKQQYKNYIINNVKIKFEQLYNINIINIYFWFILSNEYIEKNNTCIDLNYQKIKYIFYSIDQKCFFEERNINKINNLLFFEKKEAKLYSKVYNDYDIESDIKIEPFLISKFEDKLYNLSEEKETINYEKIRKLFFRNNFGLKIEKNLKNSIIDIIKTINKNNQSFYLLFLFSFPFIDFHKYKNLKDELIFILKCDNVIYFYYKDNFYEIDYQNKKIKPSKKSLLDIEDTINLKYEINYEEEEIDIALMKDLKESHIIYLYKIYYIED